MAVGVILNYSKNVYENKISQLERHASVLQGYLTDLTEYQNSLKNYWDDNEARSFYKTIGTELTGVKAALDNVTKLRLQYSDIVDEFAKTTNTVQNAVDTATLAIKGMGIGSGS